MGGNMTPRLNRAFEDSEEWARRGEPNNGARVQAAQGRPHQKERKKWKRPPQGYVKCNTDGAWQGPGTKCGIGWVLRDSNGHVMWLGARAFPRNKSVLEVELEALRWAILTMTRFRYNKVIFESDAQKLIKLLNSGEGWPHLNPTLQDIRNMLPLFEDIKFVFMPRGGNKIADRIAKESISFENYDPKLYSIVPNWLKPTVEQDVVM